MDHKHHGNGFVVGLAIGAGLALLLSTEKGRKILKTLTDEGFSKITDLETAWDEEMEYEDEGFDEPVYNQETKQAESAKDELVQADSVSDTAKSSTAHPHKAPRTSRRFFRGIPRRFNVK